MTRAMGRWRKPWLIVVAACLFHLPALWSPFLSDDLLLVAHNPRLGSSEFLREAFTRDYGLEFGERRPLGYYRPVLMVLDHALFQCFGPSPAAYRLFSLAILAANGLLLRRLLGRALRRAPDLIATTAAALYVANPTRVETVTFFMSLPDLLMESWVLLALMGLTGGHSAASPAGVTPRRLGRGLALLALGGLMATTKESGLVMAGALAGSALLLGLRGAPRGGPVINALALAAGAGGGLALRLAVGVGLPSAGGSPGALLTTWAGPWLRVIVQGVAHVVLPAPTVFIHEYTAGSASPGPATWGLIALFSALSAGWIRLWWRRHTLGACVLAALLGGLLLQGLIVAGGLPYSERYLPTILQIIALALVIGVGVEALARRREAAGRPPMGPEGQRRLGAALAVWVAWHGAQTLASSAVCLSGVAFYEAAVATAPDSPYARMSLAEAFFHERGDFESMDIHRRAALALADDPATVRRAGMLHLSMLMVRGRYPEMLEALEPLLARFPGDAQWHSQKGLALAYLGRREQALACLDAALALNPHQPRYRLQRERIATGAIGPATAAPPPSP